MQEIFPEEAWVLSAAPSAEQAAVARSPIGVSDEAMMGGWRVIIARVPDRYVAYYYHENDDARLRAALQLQAERWVASHEGLKAVKEAEAKQ